MLKHIVFVKFRVLEFKILCLCGVENVLLIFDSVVINRATRILSDLRLRHEVEEIVLL